MCILFVINLFEFNNLINSEGFSYEKEENSRARQTRKILKIQ